MDRLKETVALVTGASSGIGAATARELARRGARVILAARRADRLAEQVAAITSAGGQATAIEADVADPAALERLAREAVAVYGRVDALINNAGMGWPEHFDEMAPEGIERVVSVNLTAPMLLTRLLLPGMLERKRGAIVCVASVAGHIATDALYSATKFGVRGFALSLRRRLRGHGRQCLDRLARLHPHGDDRWPPRADAWPGSCGHRYRRAAHPSAPRGRRSRQLSRRHRRRGSCAVGRGPRPGTARKGFI